MLQILIFLFICSLNFGLSGISDPTVDEVHGAHEVRAGNEWGLLARKQHSLRILCIGGSNTARGDSLVDSYVEVLDKHLKNGSFSRTDYFKSRSFALNRGSSGFNIQSFTGMKFDFEMSNSTSTWPNVIIVETSVNLPLFTTETTITLMLERFLRSMLHKYALRNVSQPDFLFFNMPHLDKLFHLSPYPSTQQERSDYALNYPLQPHTMGWDDVIRQFASYYQVPVLSWGNATYAAAMRHFIHSNTSLVENPWPYSDDGTHMSRPVGVDFGVNRLLLPFLRNAMRVRTDIIPSLQTLVDLNRVPRLFPAGPELWILISYESYMCYGCDELYHPQLTEIMHLVEDDETDTTAWKKMHIAHSEYCFGSTAGHSVGELRFHVPRECRKDQMDCRVQTSFIHSWNSSYIGNASCSLFRHAHHHNGSSNGTFLASIFIDGQAGAEGHTIPVKTLFPVNVTTGMHSMKCVNLVKDRLSCMTALEVNAVVIV